MPQTFLYPKFGVDVRLASNEFLQRVGPPQRKDRRRPLYWIEQIKTPGQQFSAGVGGQGWSLAAVAAKEAEGHEYVCVYIYVVP